MYGADIVPTYSFEAMSKLVSRETKGEKQTYPLAGRYNISEANQITTK